MHSAFVQLGPFEVVLQPAKLPQIIFEALVQSA
jgi:hypothetical protein